MNHPASELSAQQIAGFYEDFATVRDYVASAAEQITLAGPFTHRREPRHAPRERFNAWQLRLRAAELSRLYAQLPLLGHAADDFHDGDAVRLALEPLS